jgi:hypothetical protein
VIRLVSDYRVVICFPLPVPTLVSAHNAAWSDATTLTATSYFGPELSYYGLDSGTVDKVSTPLWTTSTLIGKSVMTGTDSVRLMHQFLCPSASIFSCTLLTLFLSQKFFPSTLPSSLKVRHFVPDSTHPKREFSSKIKRNTFCETCKTLFCKLKRLPMY